jgi:predicted permease
MDFWRTWGNTLAIAGRLKPGVTVAQAQQDLDRVTAHLKQLHPDWGNGFAPTLSGLQDHVSGKLRRSLVVLWFAVGTIMLIVCVNLANLQLARAAARSKEIAVRRALGAGRVRLMTHLLTESLLLSSMGAVFGLALAYGVVYSIAHQGSIVLPLLGTLRVDGSAISWTLLVALAAGILFGIAPAIKMSSVRLQETLKDGAGSVSPGRSHEAFRSTLVVTEIALACVLLVGAGLLLRSFLRVLDVDLGFEPSHAAVLQTDIDYAGDGARRGPALQEMLRRVSALPGVESAGISDMLPLDRNRSWGLVAKGRPRQKGEPDGALIYMITPGYLRSMGMRLHAGRDFNWNDSSTSEHVIIINQAGAKREWPGQDPVGKLAYGVGRGEARVVGVIDDVRESGLETASSPEVYAPITQESPEGAELVIRTRQSGAALAPSVLATLRTLNPAQPASELRSLDTLVDKAVSPRRFTALLVAVFAGFGVMLAALGIYGVISYSVTQRTKEIGIRMALGANAGNVQRHVLGSTMRLAAVGIGLGTLAALVVARAIASLLFATQPTDPLAFAATVLLIAGVALIAGFIPAWRASRINPTVALRSN